MKWFFSVVVLLNLLLAAWIAMHKAPQADFETREVSPQLIKLLPEGWHEAEASAPQLAQVASAPQAERAAVAAKQPASAPQADSKPLALAAKADSAARQCFRWGELDSRQLARVQVELAGLRLTAAQQTKSVREVAKAGGKAWVYYPPLATQAETQTLIAELKAKGFDSYIVRSEGPFRGHLSLGLFAKESGAQALVSRLKAAGFGGAKVDARGQSSSLTSLQFTGLAAWQADKLHALQQRVLPGIALLSQPCR